MRMPTLLASSTAWTLALCACAAIAGCASVPPHLSDTSASRLGREPSLYGELIYTGEVAPLGQTHPVFQYQRFVERRDDAWVSTHLTRSSDTDAVVVLQQATHDEAYHLTRFEEVRQQTGLTSVVDVSADGRLAFSIERGDQTERSSEGGGDPVVVGPTLFGYVRTHLDELRAGNALPIRFAVADQGRSYAFSLRLDRAEGRTFVVMAASDFLVRLAIDAMRIEFDDGGDNVLTYRGRVPARLAGLQSFDAEVRYSYAVERYR